jgi:putative monooxygenase
MVSVIHRWLTHRRSKKAGCVRASLRELRDKVVTGNDLRGALTLDDRHVVIRPGRSAARERGGGVRTHYLVTPELGAQQFLSGITEFDPGASLPFHSHNCEESVVVLEGDAGFETENGSTDMNAFDTTFVPADTVHRFVNRGRAVMRILWIYGSVNATRTLTESGETLAINSAAEHPN